MLDIGGVGFPWAPQARLQQTVPDLAPDEAAARRVAASFFESFTPDSDWARFDLGLVEEDELARRIAARTGTPEDRVRRVIDAIPGHLQPQADTVALLQRLKAAGHRLYYLSNMPRSYAEHLERHNAFIGDFLDGIFSARVGLMKPHRAIFELAQERFALAGTPTVFIDDHAGNIAAAQAHGWQTVHFSAAARAERELQQAGWLPAA
ncbi:MAG: HAD family hydrolase [Rubrivivax sp.]